MLRRERPLLFSVVTMALFYASGERCFAGLSGAYSFAFLLLWLFAAILLPAFAAVRYAVSWRLAANQDGF